jgi:hypothetical protein
MYAKEKGPIKKKRGFTFAKQQKTCLKLKFLFKLQDGMAPF